MTFTRENFIDGLRNLNPSGAHGFEGLVARLIENLTGRHFHLASSGYQGGRDLSSSELNSNSIAVECKRYKEKTTLNVRELQGELAQAVENFLDLDLWVLVASRDIQSQADESLRRQAHREGIIYFAISTDDGFPSSLEILCANSIDITIEYLGGSRKFYDHQLYLQEIAARDDFEEKIKHLRNQFSSPLIGYENWRLEQNENFQDYLCSERESRIEFGQPLNINDQDVNLVDRNEAWRHLDDWIEDWVQSPIPMAILGEEGDGKTWCIASWLSKKAKENQNFPPIIFLSSEKVNTNEPIDLLANYIERKNHCFDHNFNQSSWGSRLKRWLNKNQEDSPLFILILDGINERRGHQWWRKLFENLNGEPWIKNVAILISCRKEYWQRYFSGLHHLQALEYALPPYSDEELTKALSFHGLSLSDIGEDLLYLVRKPRYLDLMIKYRERIEESGDVTIARLIYEDWQDRYQRKNFEIENQSFQQVIRNLAEKYRDKNCYMRPQDIVGDTLIPFSDKTIVLEELSTGGILQVTNSGRYSVKEDYLIYGLGLLLVDELELSDELTEEQFSNVISSWLEPHSEMDIKGRICEFSALHALNLKNYSQKAKTALLDAWISSQNPAEDIDLKVTSYLPIDPQCYVEIAEIFWSDMRENAWAQELLMQAFLKWCNYPRISSVFQGAFEKWLGFVHINGYSSQRGPGYGWSEDELRTLSQQSGIQFHIPTDRHNYLNRVQAEIEARLGIEINVNNELVLGEFRIKIVNDDGLMRLARFALAVISHLPLNQFIHALATGCLAESIMGLPNKYNLFSWVFKSTRGDIWIEVEIEIIKLLSIQELVPEIPINVCQQAAHRLLSFEGSKNAFSLQETLPDNLFPMDSMRESHRQDPCTSGFRWSRHDCQVCVQRTDLDPEKIARFLKEYCGDPELSIPEDLIRAFQTLTENIDSEQIKIALSTTRDDLKLADLEPALCAYSPYSLISFIRNLIQGIDNRQGTPLRQLTLSLKEYSLLLTQDEYTKIAAAWEALLSNLDPENQELDLIQSFLAKSILEIQEAEQQLETLLRVPEGLACLIACERHFKSLSSEEFICRNLLLPKVGLQRFLWFLSSEKQQLSEEVLNQNILPLVQNADSVIRAYALKILYSKGDKTVLEDFLKFDWSWNLESNCQENHWGSLLLCKHGSTSDFENIANRVHPIYLGYAVSCRGSDRSDVLKYAECIHAIWMRVFTQDENESLAVFPRMVVDIDPDLGADIEMIHVYALSDHAFDSSSKVYSRDSHWGGMGDDDDKAWSGFFKPDLDDQQRRSEFQSMKELVEQQLQVGNVWFAQRFFPYELEKILDECRDFVDIWLTSALNFDSKATQLLKTASSFYEALCEVLLKSGTDNRGLALYARLDGIRDRVEFRDKYTKYSRIKYSLFRGNPTQEIEQEWLKAVDGCKNDRELLEISVIVEQTGRSTWLLNLVEEALSSSSTFKQCQGATLLAFIQQDRADDVLLEKLGEEGRANTHLKRLLERSLDLRNKNFWAKHWYKIFYLAEVDSMAWAAFRLFLNYVDSRFWCWKSSIESDFREHDSFKIRVAFVEDNFDTIRNKLKKNEKPLREQYLGSKILERQAWPWM